MDDQVTKLYQLRELLKKRQINFKELTDLEQFFLGTNSYSGCKCKMQSIKDKLKAYMENYGNNILTNYESNL